MRTRSYPSIRCLLPWFVALALTGCGDATPAHRGASATEVLRTLDSIERLLDAGKTAEALRAAEALQRSVPEDALAAEMLGRARMAAHCEPGPTADAYAIAADLRADSPGLQSAAGITAAAAGRLDEALRRQRRAGELEPGNPQHALQCANLLRALGQQQEALACARRAAELAPLDPSVQLSLSQSLAATGDLPNARAAAVRALEASPRDAMLRTTVANALVAQGDPAQAIAVIQIESDQPNASRATLECLANAQAAAGLHTLAAATWQRLASAPMASWQPCLKAAECLLRADQRDQAMDWLSRARERGAPTSATRTLDDALRAKRPVDATDTSAK
jgi:Flp pilus assembly protein TadD